MIFCNLGLGKDFSENTNHKKRDKFDAKTLKTSVHQNTPLRECIEKPQTRRINNSDTLRNTADERRNGNGVSV